MRFSLGFGFAVVFGSACAVGVGWGADAHAAPGDHIQAGNAVIKPRVAVGVEANSNAFRSDADADIQPGFNFVATVGLNVALRSPRNWFDLDGEWAPRVYFTGDTQSLNQFGRFAVTAQGDFARQSVVGFTIRDTARLVPNANDTPGRPNALITQIRNDLYVGLPIRPGPEFVIQPGFNWAYHEFQIGSGGTGYRHTLSPRFDLSWRFFPNTAYVAEFEFNANMWQDDNPGGPTGVPDPNDSQLFKGWTGIRGRFTRVFLLDALVGYGFGAYSATPGAPITFTNTDNVRPLDALLVYVKPKLDFGYTAGEPLGQLLWVDYRKDFIDSYFTNYVHAHRVGLGLDSQFGRFFGTNLFGSVSFETYVGPLLGSADRLDTFVSAGLNLNFLPTRYLTITPGVGVQLRDSNETSVNYFNVGGSLMFRFEY